MIEFSDVGPFPGKEPLFPERVRIIGLGHTGAAVCDQLVLHGRAPHDLWVFDSDQQTVDASIVPNRQLLGKNLVHGLGSSGDLELAREVAALEADRLNPVAQDCDFLVLILGLAGCTGVALAEFLIEAGHEAGAKIIVMGVQPFAFEGWARREKAVQAITDLRGAADSVLVFSHDRLSEDPTTSKNVRNGFHVMHQIMAQTAQALAQVLAKRGLVQLSFADLRSLYGRYVGSEALENCWAAHVEGDIHDASEDLVEQLLAGPLVDESIWKHVDHAVAVVSGTRQFGLSDVQELIGALKDRLPPNLPVATSASLEDEGSDQVRLTLLLAMTTPSAPPVSAELPEKKKAVRQAASTKTQPMAKIAPADLPPPAPIKKSPRPVSTPVKAPSGVTGPLPVEDIAPPPPSVAVPAARRPVGKFIARQEEMQFDVPTRGRFDKTQETIHNGENLDLPTFRRRGLAIRL